MPKWPIPTASPGHDRRIQVISIITTSPDVEASILDGTFVPNDLFSTAPRPAWYHHAQHVRKSTIMLAGMIIVLLAHMGSSVPARQADIGITDAIYTRSAPWTTLRLDAARSWLKRLRRPRCCRATERSLLILDDRARTRPSTVSPSHGPSRSTSRTGFVVEPCSRPITTSFDLVRSIPAAKPERGRREWE